MTASEATGLVTIKKVPSGGAPEHIRRAWVGVTVPCYPIAGIPKAVMDVVTEQFRRETRDVVFVPQAEALEALAQQNPDAAAWWRDNGYPHAVLSYFCFGWNEVSVVSGVRLQQVIEVRDEDMGDPYR